MSDCRRKNYRRIQFAGGVEATTQERMMSCMPSTWRTDPNIHSPEILHVL